MSVKYKNLQLTVAVKRILSGVALTLLLGLFMISDVIAQRKGEITPTVSTAVRFDVSPPLREIKPLPESRESEKGEDDRGAPGPVNDTKHDKDGALQNIEGEGIFNTDQFAPPVGASFNGMTNTQGVNPPDTVGDVGTSNYVQMVNSRIQMFTKTGISVLGPININTLWSGFGGPCQTENAGDPVVLHDQLADRWIITQFTAAGPTYYNCVALSQTSDPTGSYYRYAFTTGTNFPDYPKYGIWSNGYYISTREFSASGPFAGVGAYALNRDQMLVGNPAPQVVSIILPPGSTSYRTGDGILPADLDGTTLPPAGSPEYYVGSMDNGGPYGAPADALNLFKFSVDWTTPSNSSFTFSNQINIADFDTVFPCSGSARNCIPQPGTTSRLDILSYRQRPLHRLAYRNFGTHESLVTTQSVEAQTSVAGMRWWEIRSPNSNPVIYQEGTYSPDTVNRWMGSISMDKVGNMLLGYSVSDATSVFPGIRFTGRLSTDPLGAMAQGEGTLVDGGGVQTTSNNRWGDYSSMNIDPTNDCTFWYTTEYYSTTSATGWNTRIGSVTFPGCEGPVVATYSISGKVTDAAGNGLSGVRIRIEPTGGGQAYFSQTSLDGSFSVRGLPGNQTYIVTAFARRYTFNSQTVMLTSSNAAGVNFTPNQ